jgi:hypothetical protein
VLLVGGPGWGSRRTCANASVSLRRRKPRPNLDRVCVAADTVAKICRADGLGFSDPVKIGPNRTTAVRLHQPRDAVSSMDITQRDTGHIPISNECRTDKDPKKILHRFEKSKQ